MKTILIVFQVSTTKLLNSTGGNKYFFCLFLVPRPTEAPKCTAAGLWPAPACNQYYECVDTSWLFWTSYEPKLMTCTAGDYYDTTSKSCIEAALSDCVDYKKLRMQFQDTLNDI